MLRPTPDTLSSDDVGVVSLLVTAPPSARSRAAVQPELLALPYRRQTPGAPRAPSRGPCDDGSSHGRDCGAPATQTGTLRAAAPTARKAPRGRLVDLPNRLP